MPFVFDEEVRLMTLNGGCLLPVRRILQRDWFLVNELTEVVRMEREVEASLARGEDRFLRRMKEKNDKIVLRTMGKLKVRGVTFWEEPDEEE